MIRLITTLQLAWRASTVVVAIFGAIVVEAHQASAQSVVPAPDATPELHAAVPSAMADPSSSHPLYGRTLSLAGSLALGGDDARPSVWVKAVAENGQTGIYTTAQLESLGYQVRMEEPNRIVLVYGPVRLVVRNTGTM